MRTIADQQETAPQAADAASVPAVSGWEPFNRAPVLPLTAWEFD